MKKTFITPVQDANMVVRDLDVLNRSLILVVKRR
jgi:hypothetical protein